MEGYWVFTGDHLALFQKTGIYQNAIASDEKSRELGSTPHPRLIHARATGTSPTFRKSWTC